MILQIRNDCGHSGFAFSREGVVVPSVCFTPWSGVRIPLTTAPASLPCTPLFVAMRHLPPTGGSLCSLAAVSSAAIPVWVKLKIPRANAAAATTVDIPNRWDPNTKKEPTGLFFAACGRPCSFDSSYGLHEKIPDPKIRDFIHDPYGNRTHVTAVKGPCLNRLTNGPYIIQDFAKTASNLSATIATDPQVF